MRHISNAFYPLALLIFILSLGLTEKTFAQMQTVSGLYGLGHSSMKFIDRDGDNYGPGPLAIFQTTITQSVGTGVQTVTVGATSATFTANTTNGSPEITFPAGIFAGSYDFQTGMAISGPGIPANSTVVPSTDLQAELKISNNATATATGVTLTVSIVPGTVLTVDSVTGQERIVPSAVFSGTITASFSIPHASGVVLKTQGSLGPDADDWDSTVHTGAQVLAKWGTLAAFWTKHGRDLQLDNPIPGDTASAAAIAASYASPHATWYTAPSPAILPNTVAGSDSNNCNSAATPCLTETRLLAVGFTAGDMVIARQGWSNAGASVAYTPPNGTASKYTTLVSYPGEQAVFDTGINGNASKISLLPTQYAIFENLIVQDGAQISGGTIDGAGSVQTHHILFEGIDGGNGGTGISSMSMFNGMQNMTIQDSVFHDNDCHGGGCQHGVYWGCRDIPCSNIMYRRDIAFQNDSNGFTFNGRCTGCTFEQLAAYSNGVSGFTIEEGVSNSLVASLLLVSNANNGLTIFNYPGNCVSQGGSGTICPYDQIGNVFENISIYQSGNSKVANPNGNIPSNCPAGIEWCLQSGIVVNNTTSPLAGNLGSNTFRNIVVTSYSYQNHYPPIVYGDPSSSSVCDSNCLSWMSTSVFDHIISFQTDGKGGTGVLGFGPGTGFGFHVYTCAQAAAFTTMTSCTNVDPGFATEGISLWNSEVNWDFRLVTTSPPLRTGSTNKQFFKDIAGREFLDDTPSIGAFERNLYQPGWNDLGSATKVVAPPNGAPGFTNNINFGGTAGTCNAGSQAFCYPFNGQYTNAFKTWSDCVLREKPGAAHMLACADNGGHTDWMGNAVEAFKYNTASPTWLRLSGPSTFLGDPGTGATFSATVSGGALTSCTVTAAGTGYTLGAGGIVWIPAIGDTITTAAQAIYYTNGTGGVAACKIKLNGGGAGYAHAPFRGVTPVLNTPALAYANSWGLQGVSGSGPPTNPCAQVQPGQGSNYYDTVGLQEYLCQTNGGSWSAAMPIFSGPLPEFSDGTPNSRHMTALQSYSPVLDRLLQFNGGLGGGNGQHFQDFWAYNFATNTWSRLDPTSCGSGCNFSIGGPRQFEAESFFGFSGSSVYNPLNDTHMWYFDDSGGYMSIYNPSSGQMLFGGGGSIDPNGAAINNGFARDIIPDRQLAFFVGNDAAAYQASKVDLTKLPTPGASSAETVITSSINANCAGWWKLFSGATYLSPAMAWNPAIQQFMGFNANGAGNWWSFDPDSLGCVQYTPANGPGATDASWMFGRARYSAAVDGMVVFQGYNSSGTTSQDAFVLSLNAPDPQVPCAISPSILPGGTVGSPYTATLTAAGCAAGTWAITAGTLPAGTTSTCTGANSTTSCVISGTPTTIQTASFTAAYSTASRLLSITTSLPAGGLKQPTAIR